MYQAQFAYEQFGEWQGTILRKQLNPDGTVEHEENHPGNWSSANELELQAAQDIETFGLQCQRCHTLAIGIIYRYG